MRSPRFRRLERHRTGGTRAQMTLSYPVPRSPSGKIYQFSPNPDAVPRLFLIGEAPSERKVLDEHRGRTRRTPGRGQTVCPYTGFMADDGEFVHFDDVETIKKQIQHDVTADMSDWIRNLAKDFNRRQTRGGFITINMEHRARRRTRPVAIRRDLLRDLTCDVCTRPCAVYAIALYCPDCGAPNLSMHLPPVRIGRA